MEMERTISGGCVLAEQHPQFQQRCARCWVLPEKLSRFQPQQLLGGYPPSSLQYHFLWPAFQMGAVRLLPWKNQRPLERPPGLSGDAAGGEVSLLILVVLHCEHPGVHDSHEGCGRCHCVSPCERHFDQPLEVPPPTAGSNGCSSSPKRSQV